MAETRIQHRPNPRLHADDIPVYFGSSQDSRIVYDATNDEWTVQTKNASGTFVDRFRVEANTDTPDVTLVDNPLKWSAGRAVTADDYSIGRDADGTNQTHFNVPTGASFEFSVNDVAEMVLSATDLDLKNNTLSNVGVAGSVWNATLLHISNSNVGSTVTMRTSNNDNTDGGSHARILALVGGTSGGDPYTQYQINSGETVTMGLDNSVSDNFTISDASSLGSNDRLRLVTATGVLSVDGSGSGDALPTLFDDYDDALELRTFQMANVPPELITREQQLENQRRLVEIGVAEWAAQEDGSDHWMMRVQPMTRLLAGGVFQNRIRMDARFAAVEDRMAAVEGKLRQLR